MPRLSKEQLNPLRVQLLTCPANTRLMVAGDMTDILDTIDALESEKAELLAALHHIVEVASGERQVAIDDTDGMAYIDKYTRAVLRETTNG